MVAQDAHKLKPQLVAAAPLLHQGPACGSLLIATHVPFPSCWSPYAGAFIGRAVAAGGAQLSPAAAEARGLCGTCDLGGAWSSQTAWNSLHRQWRVLWCAAAALGPVIGELEIPGRHVALNQRVAAAARATCCCLPWMALGSERDSANGK